MATKKSVKTAKKTVNQKARKKPIVKKPVKQVKNRGKETRFKPGKSGNPKGRPKNENTFSDTAREILQANELNVEWYINTKKKHLNLKSTKNFHYGLISALILEGLKGNTKATKELIDRVQGKSVQQMDHLNDGNKFESTKIYIPSNGRT